MKLQVHSFVSHQFKWYAEQQNDLIWLEDQSFVKFETKHIFIQGNAFENVSKIAAVL